MKKINYFLVLLTLVLLTGCKGSVVTFNCSKMSDQSKSGYTLKTDYKITARKDIVEKVELTEDLTSKNNTILAYFEKQYKDQYKAYNKEYGGYDYTVTKKDGKVTLKVVMDYNKIDMKKFIKNNPAMKEYVNKDNKLTTKTVKKMYENSGSKCEK